MSHMKATCSLQKRERTPTSLLVRSGPCKRSLLSDSPLNSELASKTTLILSGFWGDTHHDAECTRYDRLQEQSLSGELSRHVPCLSDPS